MMSQEKMRAMQQIQEEYRDLKENPIANIGVSVGLPNPDNIFQWRCTMIGPQDSPYKGGLFYLKILFPENYPQCRPEILYVTPIYHVNVNQKQTEPGGEKVGHICVSSLNFWTPDTRIKQVLTDIFTLFYLGNPDSAYGIDRGIEMKNMPALYEEKIQYFTKKYASATTGYSEQEGDWDFTYPNQQNPQNNFNNNNMFYS